MRRPPLPGGPYLLVGLARSGVAAALALLAAGERVIGVDAGAPGELAELRERGVELHLGEPGVELLERVRTVIKSPGVPAQAPVIEAARARSMPVLGELELGWRVLPNEFIAVTGTNGKTTTAELIGHVHRHSGASVAVAGNVGQALTGLYGQVDAEAVVVCEASSFQLEDTFAFAPEAAVLVNLSPDHLDRHGTLEAYAAAKLQAFARQREEDVAVWPAELVPGGHAGVEPVPGVGVHGGVGQARGPLPGSPAGRARRVTFGSDPDADVREQAGVLLWGPQPLMAVAELSLRGRHNVHNAMAAAAVCLARGIELSAVRAGLGSFPGVAHRLEEVARRDGVSYVNDSKATNVASTLVALEAYLDAAGVHLILGGQGKGQDFAPLREPVRRGCRAVYLMGEDGPLIARALEPANVALRECATLERALREACAAARAGEVVLLSPACASFDQFANFEARGERFRELLGATAAVH